jgi:hypothetical protein
VLAYTKKKRERERISWECRKYTFIADSELSQREVEKKVESVPSLCIKSSR